MQTASGIVMEGTASAGSDRPIPLLAQALNHATGYLGAMGAMIALARQTERGGSYRVRVALARTARWLESLGRVEASSVVDPVEGDLLDLIDETLSDFGRLRFVRPAGLLDETPPRWTLLPGRPGAEPRWQVGPRN